MTPKANLYISCAGLLLFLISGVTEAFEEHPRTWQIWFDVIGSAAFAIAIYTDLRRVHSD